MISDGVPLFSVSPRKKAGALNRQMNISTAPARINPRPSTKTTPSPKMLDPGPVVVRAGAVPQGDEEDDPQADAAEQREQEFEDEVVEAGEQVMPEIPDAADRGQPVVEADHQAERQDGVGQHGFRDEGQDP